MDTQELQRIAGAGPRHWWLQDRRELIARELRRLPEPGRAVDVGAGIGDGCAVLLDHGWRVTAVDTGERAVELCRARGADAHLADPRWLPLPSASYDLAVAFDVLSRLDDDHLAAAQLTRVLKPGGTALVAVPSDMALWSAHDVALGRSRRHTRDTFAALLAGAGLALDEMWSRGIVVRPLVRRRRHRVDGWETRRRCTAVNRLLSWTLSAEQWLPATSLPGTWLVARAHRPHDG
ncbi:class I SAM-dependent methyltransferase [Actinomadura parmotrematis]|uniref:class I SAM-dependent methyltransferase n=1 Tax=Actinomadura parmotrematis TaxID=2864039 RepID=UPI0027E31A16|nr:class I SAM-dependent methyltransferase [Actinomadura parmotrematis]